MIDRAASGVAYLNIIAGKTRQQLIDLIAVRACPFRIA